MELGMLVIALERVRQENHVLRLAWAVQQDSDPQLSPLKKL